MSLLKKFSSNAISDDKKKSRDQEIAECNTLNEMLSVLSKYHNFNKPLGPVQKTLIKNVVLPKLDEAIKKLNL